MKNIIKMGKKRKKEKKMEKDNYPENGFIYDDTGYNYLYLTKINTTFESDFEYMVIME